MGFIVPPENVVNKNRNAAGAYVDVAWEVASRFLLDLAGRYEQYSDFGSNGAGKIAARYKFSDCLFIRGSLNNGFRAPSLQQYFYSVTNRTAAIINGVLTPSTNGLFRNNSEVANAFGIPSLQAERSVNGSAGVTATVMNRIRLTVDGYWIQIRNRIVLSGAFDRRTNPEVDRLLSSYPDVDRVQFFVNAIHTNTQGVDIVLNGKWKVKNANLTTLLAANFTRTRLFGEIKTAGKLKADSLNMATLFSREERGKLERSQPASKIILSLQYKTDKLEFLLRNTLFGETATLYINPVQNPDEFFSSKILTDVSVSYTPKAWLSLMAGANNIFNVYPDRIKDYRNTQEGMHIYAQETTAFGFYGGYYFVTLSLKSTHH
jgi:iron complex outermembrane receptor protein